MSIYNDGANSLQLLKPIVMYAGAQINNGGGVTVLGGPINFTNPGFPTPGYCTFDVGGTSLSLTNTLSGTGIIYDTGGTSPLIISGASPSFTGGILEVPPAPSFSAAPSAVVSPINPAPSSRAQARQQAQWMSEAP